MFSAAVLDLDLEQEAARVVDAIRNHVHVRLRKRGVVVGLSGGVDSSVVAALCTRALGSGNVLGLFMPERDSSAEALELGKLLASHLGIESVTVDIAPILDAAGCYRCQDEAIREAVPEYADGWKFKLVLPSILEGQRLNITRLTLRSPTGEMKTVRLAAHTYLKLVAATNWKQRSRKMTEYFHADCRNYAVAGTPNRLEYDQGFFVKQGDGAADLKPIAHLYKTQVYALAAFLGVPQEIRSRPPTTDTFSLPQTQEEFYFALPYDRMDLCLYARDHGVTPRDVAGVVGLSEVQVERVFKDIDAKRRAAGYLHMPPLTVGLPSEGEPFAPVSSARPASAAPG